MDDAVTIFEVAPGWRQMWLTEQQRRLAVMRDDLMELDPRGWNQSLSLSLAVQCLGTATKALDRVMDEEEGSTE